MMLCMSRNDCTQPRFEYVAEGVYRLAVATRNAINVYLIDDVLVDAGARQAGGKILQALEGCALRGHVVTHVHPDHQGATHEICTARGIPLWCGAADREAMETGNLASCYPRPEKLTARIPSRLWGGPAHPVERSLVEGDTIGDFEVLETPGHTAGHIALWRRDDGVLIVGDVLFGMSLLTLRRALREPPRMFTVNPAQNRESIRRLALLKPRVVCCGHGLPIYGQALLRDFAAGLPETAATHDPADLSITAPDPGLEELGDENGQRIPSTLSSAPYETPLDEPIDAGDLEHKT